MPRRRASRRPPADDPFRFYRLLAGYAFLSTYRAKFVAIVATCLGAGTLVLMAVIVFGAGRLSVLSLLAVVLLTALVTGVAIAWAIDRLLRPLKLAARAIDALAENVDLPRMDLPGTDEAAHILRGVQSVIGRLHRQEDQTRSASDFDELTGLYQRRAGRARAQALVESETRQGRSVRVVVADVEGMRAFNAKYGHGQGDALLKMLAARVAHIAGERGIAARWSGDRFLLVQTTAIESAAPLADVFGRPVVIKGSDESVRLAWGDVTVDAPVAIDDVIAQAEERLPRENPAG
jgi:diguanylate cyclase (GGDEF)-like protein